MKIAMINPGILPIPRTNYGAIERIIWDYKIYLERAGHTVDIKYPNDISSYQYDIVHVHVANQALMLAERNIPYIFHLHDHHVVRFGKHSPLYKQNKEAIDKSILSLVPAEYLVEWFENPYKVFYFKHGVNTEYFKPSHNKVLDYGPRLLCVANNGYADDPVADRKGFDLAIQAATELGLNLTIVGPAKNNADFFASRSLPSNVKTIFDVSDEAILAFYQNSDIFIHLSELEAGQPNLTLLEALACGLPVVGTYQGAFDLPGLKRVNRNIEDVKKGINEIILNYSNWQNQTLEVIKDFNYKTICESLINIYKNILHLTFFSQTFKDRLTFNYLNTEIKPTKLKRLPEDTFNFSFINGAQIEIGGYSGKTYSVEFIDLDSGISLFNNQMKPGNWAKTKFTYLINYDIRVKDETGRLVKRHLFNPTGKTVYIHLDSKALGDTIAWFPYIEEFRNKYNCKVICSTFWNHLFERIYHHIQFVAPGTTVNDLYAMFTLGIFDPADRYRHKNDPRSIPLQQVASDILGLDKKEIKPVIYTPTKKIVDKPKKFVAISTASTAQAKYWNYPGGWQQIVDCLKDLDYEVLLIQKEYTDLKGVIHLKSENIFESIDYLQNCEFFIGLSSGISWLAWALNIPVVMISGFTAPWNEFKCIRIHTEAPCHSCWNDRSHKFDPGNWNWCPRGKDFICTKTITPNSVISILKNHKLV